VKLVGVDGKKEEEVERRRKLSAVAEFESIYEIRKNREMTYLNQFISIVVLSHRFRYEALS
jgi:hypothetical protein